jgi:hypothetical protein
MFNDIQARGNSALLVGLDGATPILPREVLGRTTLTQIGWGIPCFGGSFGDVVSNRADGMSSRCCDMSSYIYRSFVQLQVSRPTRRSAHEESLERAHSVYSPQSERA